MNYTQALDYIHGTLKFGIKLGLDNIKGLLALMDNPQQQLKFVHVAGTNGKGSVVSYISSILLASGYRVGTFTSPFLERFTERMCINQKEIEAEALARITTYVREKVETFIANGGNHPTEFEIVTAIAFQYFFENNCDIVVLEVGLGGRFDSTNVIQTPELAVITTIGYDHMDRLGNTLPKIAFEKGGIIKENGDVLLYPQLDEVEDVFKTICIEKNACLHHVDFSAIRLIDRGIEGQVFDYQALTQLKIVLLGEHQIKNAVMAVHAAHILKKKGYKITDESLRQGLMNTRWAGRIEILHQDPLFIIDGAHNTEGATALRSTLDQYFPENRKILIVGVMKDKDYQKMIEIMVPDAAMVFAVTVQNERALPALELAKIMGCYCKNISLSDTIENAIIKSMQVAQHNDIICAFGSLFYLGDIRKYFRHP